MTTLIDRVMGGVEVRSHSSKLGKILVMPFLGLTLSTPIFNKKSHWTPLVEWTGVGSPTSKLGTFFEMPLALSTPIFNKKFDRT